MSSKMIGPTLDNNRFRYYQRHILDSAESKMGLFIKFVKQKKKN